MRPLPHRDWKKTPFPLLPSSRSPHLAAARHLVSAAVRCYQRSGWRLESGQRHPARGESASGAEGRGEGRRGAIPIGPALRLCGDGAEGCWEVSGEEKMGRGALFSPREVRGLFQNATFVTVVLAMCFAFISSCVWSRRNEPFLFFPHHRALKILV